MTSCIGPEQAGALVIHEAWANSPIAFTEIFENPHWATRWCGDRISSN
jgi:hypothetical protein